MVMPLIVAPKPGKPGKFRLIHDCRVLNRHLRRYGFEMERLADFVKELRRGDRLWSIDLASAYHHIEIHPRFCTLVGFEFEGVYYVYRCLPFGLSVSAYVFCRFSAITAAAIRESGLATALICYVDDLGGSIGPARDPGRMRAIVDLIRSFNWSLAPDKMVLGLDTQIRLLGFLLDTDSMLIRVPDDRRLKLKSAAQGVLDSAAAVRARSVCQVIGQVLSLQLSLGIVCRLWCRYLNLSVRDASRLGEYDRRVALCPKARGELERWLRELDSLKERAMHVHKRKATYVLHCDASDHALGAIVVAGPHGREVGAKFYRRLAAHEAAWSSALRELTGYRDAVVTLARRTPLRGEVVDIVGDSQVCEAVFRNGGSQCQDEATGDLLMTDALLELHELAAREGFDFRMTWVRREFVQDADDLSKFVDRMDFSLAPAAAARVRAELGPWDVDRFASPSNAMAPRFNALFDGVGVEAVNAFVQDWSVGTSFVLPDFHRIPAVLDMIERFDAVAVVVVPKWPHKRWWGRLLSGPWQERVERVLELPADSLVANNQHCFFGTHFTTRLVAFRTRRMAGQPSPGAGGGGLSG